MKEHIDQSQESLFQRAEILIEALPYIREFSGKVIVIKYGGSAMIDEGLRHKIIQDIALLKYVGIIPIIVHGGGPAINSMLTKLGVESNFHQGMRITDAATMEVTEMVLAGKVNKDLVRLLRLQSIPAVGLSGKDGMLFTAEKQNTTEADLGLVGKISAVNTSILRTLFDGGFVPVVAPVSMADDGTTYNINADEAAVALAAGLKAEKLMYLTDVPGVLRRVGDRGSLISKLTTGEAEALIQDGTIAGGMVPKVRCALEAVQGGAATAHIIDGTLPHSLLLEILTAEGVGTVIQAD